MFNTVLIANRGEIAVRINRTLRALGVRSVAVYSDGDADARHVHEADAAIRLGPTPATQSYLCIGKVIDAAHAARADAVHPGYGFLAENAEFARACIESGITFIGPPPDAIEAMGDKIRAKRTVSAAGVAVVPGRVDSDLSDDDLIEAAEAVGYPVLIKPSAGGGGKGMRLVHDRARLAAELAAARREARAAFGDDALLIERFIERPRHIEVQVLADTHGGAVHLGERECSLQRRHQKIIEEAPSPLLSPEQRGVMGEQALAAARACGYVNAGTVEFIVSATRPDEFFFMEMNTRLQVEHPVTELVWGVDLVELQLRVAAGEHLPFCQSDLRARGHAIEARVYAEDPDRGFLPTGGTVLALREPDTALVRTDCGISRGFEVSAAYDPMLAKLIAWAPSRFEAIRRLDRGLANTVILGVTTNVAFLRRLLQEADILAGRLDTGLVERMPTAPGPPQVPDEVVAAAAIARGLVSRPGEPITDPWHVPGGWRVGESAWCRWTAEVDGRVEATAWLRGASRATEVRVDDAPPVAYIASIENGHLLLEHGGITGRYAFAVGDNTLWLGREGQTWAFTEAEPRRAGATQDRLAHGTITSPMPGSVVIVCVSIGDYVKAGQAVLVVEAMKMEHTLVAPFDGLVTELHVTAGQQVSLKQLVALIEPAGE